MNVCITDGILWAIVPLGNQYNVHESTVFLKGRKGKVTVPSKAMLAHCPSEMDSQYAWVSHATEQDTDWGWER